MLNIWNLPSARRRRLQQASKTSCVQQRSLCRPAVPCDSLRQQNRAASPSGWTNGVVLCHNWAASPRYPPRTQNYPPAKLVMRPWTHGDAARLCIRRESSQGLARAAHHIKGFRISSDSWRGTLGIGTSIRLMPYHACRSCTVSSRRPCTHCAAQGQDTAARLLRRSAGDSSPGWVQARARKHPAAGSAAALARSHRRLEQSAGACGRRRSSCWWAKALR